VKLSRRLACNDVNGCTYSNEIAMATCPQGYVRVSLIACLVPHYPSMDRVVSTIPPHSMVDIGCSYSGNLDYSLSIDIGATVLCANAPL
jgi:hypothetical protein